MNKGEEIVKPLRKTMKKLARCPSRNTAQKLVEANFQTHPMKRIGESLANVTADVRQTVVKKGIIENKNGNANCTCGKVETQWHLELQRKRNS
jgi:hypothetical protein